MDTYVDITDWMVTVNPDGTSRQKEIHRYVVSITVKPRNTDLLKLLYGLNVIFFPAR